HRDTYVIGDDVVNNRLNFSRSLDGVLTKNPWPKYLLTNRLTELWIHDLCPTSQCSTSLSRRIPTLGWAVRLRWAHQVSESTVSQYTLSHGPKVHSMTSDQTPTDGVEIENM
ncbi:hypothetical protein J6590_014443, partial [Homalodisca vitripennis]